MEHATLTYGGNLYKPLPIRPLSYVPAYLALRTTPLLNLRETECYPLAVSVSKNTSVLFIRSVSSRSMLLLRSSRDSYSRSRDAEESR